MIEGLSQEQQEDGCLLRDMFEAVNRLRVPWEVKLKLRLAILTTIEAVIKGGE